MSQTSPLAFLFPGQGSQYIGMGRDFYDTFSVARETFQEADEILERSLSKIIFSGPEDALTETSNSQVAIFTVSVALFRVLAEQLPRLQGDLFAGHSLGEYSALMASGRLSFADTLRLVSWRSQYMSEAAQRHAGAMAVVLGLDGPAVEAVVAELALPSDLWAANFNCPGQVVISGTLKGIEKGSEALLARGAKRVMPLKVSGAFHSGLMQEAERRLEERLRVAPIIDTPKAFVMNVTGEFCLNAEEARRNLTRQVTGAVRWEQGVRAIDARGTALYIEVGGGKTLAGLNKRIGVTGRTVNLEKVTDLDLLAEIATS